jgi:DNA-binding NtrC family response regulator
VSDATKTAVSTYKRPAKWRLEVTTGPSKGVSLPLTEGTIRIGSAKTNDVVVDDRKVSRHHVEVEVTATGVRVRDLQSKNGTFYEMSRIESADLPPTGATLTIGESEIMVLPAAEPELERAPNRVKCGRLYGKADVMKALFAQIEKVAKTKTTVLIQGETGSGKELVAEALHELSARKSGPFVVVDCGAIPRELIESELFGHAKGAFTGASSDRRGAFERAHGGTLFLDEIGELELDLQPKLLRALESGSFRPVGKNKPVTVDVRVVSASMRDLADEVKQKRFRPDLFYRLSVVRLEVPPLRTRLDDLPLLCKHFLKELDAPPLGPDALMALAQYGWPGNVRQLRNVLERAHAMARGGPLHIRHADLDDSSARVSPAMLLSLPYDQAKAQILETFTREYVEALLDRNHGNVSAAAKEAGVDRNWIIALARRNGVEVRD